MRLLSCITLLAGASLLVAQPQGTKTYATPEEARDAIVQAAAAGIQTLRTVLGPGAAEVVQTGDEVQDKEILAGFNRRVAEKVQLEQDPSNLNRMDLLTGAEESPFALPLMRKNGRWYWDVQEGKKEIRNRVIGANELNTIQICRGYVEAQQKYAESDWDGNGVLEYAKKIVSTEGKKDGLYWPGDDSPISEGFAKAHAQGYNMKAGSGSGYHGYTYRILMSQGPDAAGGAQDYLVHGLMIGGFALVASPVKYGVSGIMTFIVNQDGVVYEKDLGPYTDVQAKAISKFNPDKTWNVSVAD
jgi:hypothetical protein